MHAIAISRYGGPEVLEPTELPSPPLGPDVVLVRTRAAGVNPVDYKAVAGGLEGGFPCHFPLVPGWDVAGTVEAAGPDVAEFAPGDEVIAYARRDDVQWGTYAELVPVPVRAVAPKPASTGWAEAGALPLAGLTAWQALERGLGVGAGDVVLVHAAGGGVGHLAVQLALVRGAARVIGTASPSTFDFVRSLGAEPVAYGPGLAERVLDLVPGGVDAVLDLAGGEALAATPALLKPAGRLTSILEPDTVAKLEGRYVFVRPDGAQLAELGRLVDEGRLGVHLERTFPLDDAADAHRQLMDRHVHGKLALMLA
ncbi:MAG TPA: NADP-dependent oxidoreductase [Acidimicrobiales bacterium]|nr:NADP-dependent oxidoreductase [Acidimicrobiales bacterium]